MPKRRDSIATLTLRKGYVAWGSKECWGNLISYDAGLHPTFDAAVIAVEARRSGGWGIAWRIRHEPVCVASDKRRSFAFSLSAEYPVPTLVPRDRPMTMAD